MTAVVVVAYIACGLGVARLAVAAFVRYCKDEAPRQRLDNFDWAVGTFFAMFAGAFWPVVVVGLVVYHYVVAPVRRSLENHGDAPDRERIR